eukprot:scaffold47_cov258-Pinguiococcus_pyrenoidosus.AAC.16
MVAVLDLTLAHLPKVLAQLNEGHERCEDLGDVLRPMLCVLLALDHDDEALPIRRVPALAALDNPVENAQRAVDGLSEVQDPVNVHNDLASVHDGVVDGAEKTGQLLFAMEAGIRQLLGRLLEETEKRQAHSCLRGAFLKHGEQGVELVQVPRTRGAQSVGNVLHGLVLHLARNAFEDFADAPIPAQEDHLKVPDKVKVAPERLLAAWQRWYVQLRPPLQSGDLLVERKEKANALRPQLLASGSWPAGVLGRLKLRQEDTIQDALQRVEEALPALFDHNGSVAHGCGEMILLQGIQRGGDKVLKQASALRGQPALHDAFHTVHKHVVAFPDADEASGRLRNIVQESGDGLRCRLCTKLGKVQLDALSKPIHRPLPGLPFFRHAPSWCGCSPMPCSQGMRDRLLAFDAESLARLLCLLACLLACLVACLLARLVRIV